MRRKRGKPENLTEQISKAVLVEREATIRLLQEKAAEYKWMAGRGSLVGDTRVQRAIAAAFMDLANRLRTQTLSHGAEPVNPLDTQQKRV